jgi:uncharacterized protein
VFDDNTGESGSRSAGLIARAVLAALRGYKLVLSPLFAGSCRFMPSCSMYMSEAVTRHGAGRGVWLGLIRLLRCHPLGSSGFDPVPTPVNRPHIILQRVEQSGAGLEVK